MPNDSRGPTPADVLILAVEWHTRAPLRAQLIEAGFEVVATDSWEMMRGVMQRSLLPRLAIVDLRGLPAPEIVLDALRRVIVDPTRVLVLGALGTLPVSELARAGFQVIPRPMAIRDIVALVRARLGEPGAA